MKIRFILSALATVLLATNVQAGRQNEHMDGCTFNKRAAAKDAARELGEVTQAEKHFEMQGKTKEAKHCKMVAKKYENYISTHTQR